MQQTARTIKIVIQRLTDNEHVLHMAQELSHHQVVLAIAHRLIKAQAIILENGTLHELVPRNCVKEVRRAHRHALNVFVTRDKGIAATTFHMIATIANAVEIGNNHLAGTPGGTVHQALYSIGLHPIIGIVEGDPLALGHIQAQVARS